MLSALDFKRVYFFGIVLFGLIAYGIYLLLKVSPLEQTIVYKEKVNNLANLYVTEANAGATTGFSYRFYLYDGSKSDEDFKRSLMDTASPFLITSDSKALDKIKNGVIYLNIKGRIYSFNNNPAYRYNDSIYKIPAVITAAPY
ncbi:hypothetical protein [Pantoea sp.]|uniref:hypothetical protein n=1 Tax=Pantoea sp. TaxID=69393 RepID=UPI0031DA349A